MFSDYGIYPCPVEKNNLPKVVHMYFSHDMMIQYDITFVYFYAAEKVELNCAFS